MTNEKKLNILVSNDDGIEAPGLQKLVEELKNGVGKVAVGKKATVAGLELRRARDQLGFADRTHLGFADKGGIRSTNAFNGPHTAGYLLDVNARISRCDWH